MLLLVVKFLHMSDMRSVAFCLFPYMRYCRVCFTQLDENVTLWNNKTFHLDWQFFFAVGSTFYVLLLSLQLLWNSLQSAMLKIALA